MKIAQVAPLTEAVPPKMYGGTERVVAYLTDALVELGHDVTLFASGDSETKATLAPIWPRALRLDPNVRDPFVPMFMQLETVARRAHEFDFIHCHLDYFGFSLLRRLDTPSITTLHGRLDLAELPALYELYGDIPVVSISDSQRVPLPQANYVATVLHGLPQNLLAKGAGRGGYLAFLGRISPEKAPDAAIRIAARAGVPLKIAAKVDRVDEEYFRTTIEPLLSLGDVEFIGEIREDQKQEFLGNAAGLLFPIAWREPFGLVMIEAMACGTPVIAVENGSVPEVLEHELTAFIVHSEEAAADAVSRIGSLDRDRIRAEFERRFTAQHMAQNYLKLYSRMGRAGRVPTLTSVVGAKGPQGDEFLPGSLVTSRHGPTASPRDSLPAPAIADAGMEVLQ
ncbi:MAG TPA: glycosyltransferase family 4 protein [Steroidobacteraceae bacterium]|jgi:glycosyltransferase involved in cell wall biosynthesis|nr:glycosyltransferase family 4 protein [Steroidobacteraceae bacterium]